MRTPGRLREAADLLRRDPREVVDRLRNRVVASRENCAGRAFPAGQGYPTREQARERARELFGYETDDGWERRLHERLGAPWPCPHHEAFAALWAELDAALSAASGRRTGGGLDADSDLARTHWCVVHHLRPAHVVETGVARGISSRVLLEALRRCGGGTLHSIDLPPKSGHWREASRAAVPASLEADWEFLRGASRRHLPPLLRRLGEVDYFVHDSQHTHSNMRFELELAWRHVRPGGVVVADDIHENAAFATLTAALPPEDRIVAQERGKAGLFGIAFRSAPGAPPGRR